MTAVIRMGQLLRAAAARGGGGGAAAARGPASRSGRSRSVPFGPVRVGSGPTGLDSIDGGTSR